MVDIDTDTEIEIGTESKTEIEFEDDFVAKAACGRRSGDGRGTNPAPPCFPVSSFGVETPVVDVHDLRSSESVVSVRSHERRQRTVLESESETGRIRTAS
jgi:hypothetical protein